MSINPANLAAGTYTSPVAITAAGATGSPVSVTITLVVQGTQPAGTITAVGNAGSFQPGFASATWVTIFGTNLSSNTYSWQASDFSNGLLPTSLDGVSVSINGIPAYVAYISPTQINVLAPDDPTMGPVPVLVTTAQQASNSLTVQKSQFCTCILHDWQWRVCGRAACELQLWWAAPNLPPGVTSNPAQPGETIQLYGTGSGPDESHRYLTDQLISHAIGIGESGSSDDWRRDGDRCLRRVSRIGPLSAQCYGAEPAQWGRESGGNDWRRLDTEWSLGHGAAVRTH